eukprot:6207141-Pleurochrysis_carterae.AAC.2
MTNRPGHVSATLPCSTQRVFKRCAHLDHDQVVHEAEAHHWHGAADGVAVELLPRRRAVPFHRPSATPTTPGGIPTAPIPTVTATTFPTRTTPSTPTTSSPPSPASPPTVPTVLALSARLADGAPGRGEPRRHVRRTGRRGGTPARQCAAAKHARRVVRPPPAACGPRAAVMRWPSNRRRLPHAHFVTGRYAGSRTCSNDHNGTHSPQRRRLQELQTRPFQPQEMQPLCRVFDHMAHERERAHCAYPQARAYIRAYIRAYTRPNVRAYTARRSRLNLKLGHVHGCKHKCRRGNRRRHSPKCRPGHRRKCRRRHRCSNWCSQRRRYRQRRGHRHRTGVDTGTGRGADTDAGLSADEAKEQPEAWP